MPVQYHSIRFRQKNSDFIHVYFAKLRISPPTRCLRCATEGCVIDRLRCVNELDLTIFNKIAIQGTPQMAVDKEANSLSRV